MEVLNDGAYKNIGRTKYTNDKQITDHYAIIPTGQGFGTLKTLSKLSADIYELIARRFLAIFYPAAVYSRITFEGIKENESFFSSFKLLKEEGYLKVMSVIRAEQDDDINDSALLDIISKLKKGDNIAIKDYEIKEGETSPPKRYTSGSMILAMENAGQLIEDESLREQIKGSGIGTSATRAEILKKLVNISYLDLNKKTQVITSTQLGEMIYDVVNLSIRPLLNPELTASWE